MYTYKTGQDRLLLPATKQSRVSYIVDIIDKFFKKYLIKSFKNH